MALQRLVNLLDAILKVFFKLIYLDKKGGCMSMPFPNDTPKDTMDNVGLPLDHTEIKIVDRKSGQLVPLNQEGKLQSYL